MGRKQLALDPVLFGLAFLASLLGLFFIFDAGYPREIAQGRSPISGTLISHGLATIAGVALFFIVSKLNPKKLVKSAVVLWGISVVTLFFCHIPGLMHPQNGAERWFKLPLLPPIQPAEFVKLTTILFLAAVFSTREEWKPRKTRDLFQWMDKYLVKKLVRYIPALLVMATVILIEKEPDLGTAAVVLAIAIAMMFVGGISRSSIVIGACFTVLGLYVLTHQASYRLDRIANHQHRWTTQQMDELGYQTVQSELGHAEGYLIGVGPGNGRAKHVLPAATTDFMLATIAEEFGFFGSMVVMTILGLITFRLLTLAQQVQSKFAQLTLAGTAAWIGVQGCINVMMANGLLPAIGIPLPFFSSGGSSIFALWLTLGVCNAALAHKPKEIKSSETSRDGWRNGRTRLSRA